ARSWGREHYRYAHRRGHANIGLSLGLSLSHSLFKGTCHEATLCQDKQPEKGRVPCLYKTQPTTKNKGTYLWSGCLVSCKIRSDIYFYITFFSSHLFRPAAAKMIKFGHATVK